MELPTVDSVLSGWLPWQPLDGSWLGNRTPKRPGLYRIRRIGCDELDYIGQTGLNLKGRLGMLRGVYASPMPFRDPHTAGPALWALRHGTDCDFEASVLPFEGNEQLRRGVEAVSIALHRQQYGHSPTIQWGRMPPGYTLSSPNHALLVVAGKRYRGGLIAVRREDPLGSPLGRKRRAPAGAATGPTGSPARGRPTPAGRYSPHPAGPAERSAGGAVALPTPPTHVEVGHKRRPSVGFAVFGPGIPWLQPWGAVNEATHTDLGSVQSGRDQQLGIPPVGPLAGAPVGVHWCGHAWSDWTSVSDTLTHIAPGSLGIYRIRRPDQADLSYIGQGKVRERLAAHLAKGHSPTAKQHDWFTGLLLGSWVLNAGWNDQQRLELENDLIAAHLLTTRRVPAAQFLG